jgi:hypothetical protein
LGFSGFANLQVGQQVLVSNLGRTPSAHTVVTVQALILSLVQVKGGRSDLSGMIESAGLQNNFLVVKYTHSWVKTSVWFVPHVCLEG